MISPNSILRTEDKLIFDYNPSDSASWLYELPAAIYGGLFTTFFLSNTVSCSFESTTTIYESQYKCTSRENEFNSSQNRTLIDYSTGYDISVYNQGNYYDSFQLFFYVI